MFQNGGLLILSAGGQLTASANAPIKYAGALLAFSWHHSRAPCVVERGSVIFRARAKGVGRQTTCSYVFAGQGCRTVSVSGNLVTAKKTKQCKNTCFSLTIQDRTREVSMRTLLEIFFGVWPLNKCVLFHFTLLLTDQ